MAGCPDVGRHFTMYVTLAFELFPRLSVATTVNVNVPATVVSTFAPDATGPAQDAMPDPVSLQE
jgi:hypothetical protein